MKPTIATILIKANQNSASPKLRTPNKLKARISPTVTRAGSHAGNPGHQNFV